MRTIWNDNITTESSDAMIADGREDLQKRSMDVSGTHAPAKRSKVVSLFGGAWK